MAPRRREYLYIYVSKTVEITESTLGSGKTLTAKFCASANGDPSAIGTLTETATASGSLYAVEFTMADLVSQLGPAHIGETVYLHLTDSVAWRDVYEYVVTDKDPDLCEPLL